MAERVKVMIVDDHPVVRQGLKSLFESHGGFEVVGEAGNGVEALKLVPKAMPDVVVMDLEMPVLNGIEATRGILAEYPGVKVVVLSMHSEESYIFQALKAGAAGYLLKDSGFGELADAVNAAMRGEQRFSPPVSRKIMDSYLEEPDAGKKERAREGLLTGREREVLRLIAEGFTNNQIATRIGISVKTVETHRTNLMKKLDIHEVASLTKYAIKSGLVVLGRG